MFLNGLEESKEINPIIVCGAARSGTRMVTDLLNEHPEIAVQEEMHAKTIESFFAFLKNVDDVYDHYSERKGRRLDGSWNLSKAAFAHTFFACANKKDCIGTNKSLKFHGIKTPGYERYFEEFESVFSTLLPHYVYCVRPVAKVWRSWRSMGYLSDLEVFKIRYQRSLRQAIKIKASAASRFVLFDLESFVESDNKEQFVHDNLFSRLGFGEKSVRLASISSLPNRNSLKNRGREYVKDEALQEEVALLEGCTKIREFKEKLGLVAV
ncbi:sulfotransferase [Microbulbifer salipaludis]|nr:sulfotransferase [Microbulbifer salipaludis]